MKPIRMVDLEGQHQKLQPALNNKIIEVVASTAYINGKEVKDFSHELANYLNVKEVIPCANGTDALQIALMALDLQPGDEVITANFTYVATAEVIALLRLKPVLVDVNPETFNISPSEIEKAITPKTKAIVPVHLFGQCADMEPIMKIAKKYNLFVIEDTAQAIGATYTFSDGSQKKAGTIGDIGTTSFFPSKNLGCMGDGGALFTNNENLGSKIRTMANHGQGAQYHHDTIGVNSRLDTIQAALLRMKLKHLDEYCEARIEAANFYDKALAKLNHLEIPFRVNNSTHVFHQYVLKLTDASKRDKLKIFLLENDIPCNIYYPIPLNEQKGYKDLVTQKKYPITKDLCSRVIALPIHTELEEEQQKYIIQIINKFFNK
jgi:dTDP-4-amino-4,6-dideoxygalactose transaminase